MVPSRSGPQRDDPGGEPAGRLRGDVPVDDRVGPLAVDVDVVAGGVEVPGARRPAAGTDLGEVEPLGPEEPFHVRGRRADAERLDDPLAHLAQLVVAGRRRCGWWR